jgi:hypothetical protein
MVLSIPGQRFQETAALAFEQKAAGVSLKVTTVVTGN